MSHAALVNLHNQESGHPVFLPGIGQTARIEDGQIVLNLDKRNVGVAKHDNIIITFLKFMLHYMFQANNNINDFFRN